MQTIYLNPADVPTILDGAFNYTGRKYSARLTDSVPLDDMQWSGGTRSSYRLVNLRSGEVTNITDDRPFPSNQSAPKPLALPPGFAVVEWSIFCGKDMGLTFHIHPLDKHLIPEPDDSVTDDQRIVLKYTATLKNSYGGKTDIRFTTAHYETGIDRDTWHIASRELIAGGYLRKNGSITPKGRNATGDRY